MTRGVTTWRSFGLSCSLTPSNISILSHSLTPMAYRSLRTLAQAILPCGERLRVADARSIYKDTHQECSLYVSWYSQSPATYLHVRVLHKWIEADKETMVKETKQNPTSILLLSVFNLTGIHTDTCMYTHSTHPACTHTHRDRHPDTHTHRRTNTQREHEA